MRAAILIIIFVSAPAAPARAQSRAAEAALSVYVAGGATGAGVRDASPRAIAWLGLDIGASEGWGLRLEAGRRFPADRTRIVQQPYYGGTPPEVVEVLGTIESTTTTTLDLAALARHTWTRGRGEVTTLLGVRWQREAWRTRSRIPRSITPPDFEETEHEGTLWPLVFDLGVEVGYRLSDRLTSAAYVMLGENISENRKSQPRSGVMLRIRL